MKDKMTIQELMELHNMTIHELIEMTKLKGEALKFDILSLPNDKHSQRALILFEDRYFAIYEILDNYEDTYHYADIQVFKDDFTARICYERIVKELNGEIYE